MTPTVSSPRPTHALTLTALCALSALAAVPHAAADDDLYGCASGLYRVGYTSAAEPIEINEIHSWVLHVETADGEPVRDADITIEGGMPEHDHGLPTRPIVTEALGDGDYRVGGMRFHMSGEWALEITIDAAPGRDVCTIPLTL